MSRIRRALSILFLGGKNLDQLKLEALEENTKSIAYIHSSDFLSGNKEELKDFLRTEPPDLNTVVVWLDSFLDKVLEEDRYNRSKFLYSLCNDIASLNENEYNEWVDFLAMLNNRYVEAANIMLKEQVSLLQTEVLEEYPEPEKLFDLTPDNETFH